MSQPSSKNVLYETVENNILVLTPSSCLAFDGPVSTVAVETEPSTFNLPCILKASTDYLLPTKILSSVATALWS